MDTKILSTIEEDLKEAGRILRGGGLVAFPTETVYGLGADAMNTEAVAKVYKAKGRPSDNPMIIHIAEREHLYKLSSKVTPVMETLADKFWPGPLTMVVMRNPDIPDTTTGGLDTVGIRLPASETARKIIRYADCPIAAPSANLSGKPSPTRAVDVIEDLAGRVDAIVEGEDCEIGLESTVVMVEEDRVTVLRPGRISPNDIKEALEDTGARLEIDSALLKQSAGDEVQTPKAPGMKYRHYAPKAEMIIVSGAYKNVLEKISEIKKTREHAGQKVGILDLTGIDEEKAARRFFSCLRDMDSEGVDLILAVALEDRGGLDFAIMNRMFKSAGYKILEV